MWDVCRIKIPNNIAFQSIEKKKCKNFYIFYAATSGDQALEIENEKYGLFIDCLLKVIHQKISLKDLEGAFKMKFKNRPDNNVITEIGPLGPYFENNFIDARGLHDEIYFIGDAAARDKYENNRKLLF